MNKTVIFDLDGTLADTAPSLADAMNAVVVEKGKERIPDDKIISFVGNGVSVLVRKAYDYVGLSCNEAEEAEGIERFRFYYAKNHTEAPIYSGVAELVCELKKYGVILGVLSNKPDRFVKPITDTLFGEGTFAFSVGQTDKPRKPDPTVLLELIESVDSSPENCIYVGDSDVDVKTAHNAGVRLCAVSWGFRSEEVLRDAGADFVTDSAEALLNEIKKILKL